MKKTNYFSHDSSARNDDKIIAVRMRHGAAGYAVYFMLLERLREDENYSSVKDYNIIAFDFRVSSEVVKSVVEDFGLFSFTEDGKRFYSDKFSQRMRMKDEVSNKRSEAGKKGGNPNFKKGETNPYYDLNNQKDNQMLIEKINKNENLLIGEINKKSKVKESKVNLKEKEKEKSENAKRFTPPSLSEVENYISEKKYSVDAEAFIAFYTAKDWYIGKNKMKDWRAALITWQKREKNHETNKRNTYGVGSDVSYKDYGEDDLPFS
ncbi:MAG: DUF4373 domain-containing protein [Prevotellaceae bacterium]|jgi:hypothetical protein|nr:DUF4373 domain-containing protein [Prevotellaceae bacterium]